MAHTGLEAKRRGAEVLKIREQLGWTQMQMARAIGVSVRTMGLIESGVAGKIHLLAARQVLHEVEGGLV